MNNPDVLEHVYLMSKPSKKSLLNLQTFEEFTLDKNCCIKVFSELNASSFWLVFVLFVGLGIYPVTTTPSLLMC